jgi:hypothetical protein
VVVIPAGLAILATEFLWARRALSKCKELIARVRHRSGRPARPRIQALDPQSANWTPGDCDSPIDPEPATFRGRKARAGESTPAPETVTS